MISALDLNVRVNQVLEAAKISTKPGQAVTLPPKRSCKRPGTLPCADEK